jgi:hypothetical protein
MKWREVNYFHHSDRKRQSGSDRGIPLSSHPERKSRDPVALP